jgi:hypothetical protein
MAPVEEFGKSGYYETSQEKEWAEGAIAHVCSAVLSAGRFLFLVVYFLISDF